MGRRLRLSRRTFPSPHAGRKIASAHFTLLSGTGPEGGCAAVVSKKIARRSVDRHLLKRRMLAVAAPWARTDRFIVLYARSGSATLPFRALADELGALMQRAFRS